MPHHPAMPLPHLRALSASHSQQYDAQGVFHLQSLDHATIQNKIYLIQIISRLEVYDFFNQKPERVKANPMLLQETLTREFYDPESEQGLIVALGMKQGRKDTPQAYYNCLH